MISDQINCKHLGDTPTDIAIKTDNGRVWLAWRRIQRPGVWKAGDHRIRGLIKPLLMEPVGYAFNGQIQIYYVTLGADLERGEVHEINWGDDFSYNGIVVGYLREVKFSAHRICLLVDMTAIRNLSDQEYLEWCVGAVGGE